MRIAAALVCTAFALPLAAQEPMDMKKLTADFVSICGTAMRSKEEAGASALLRGYSQMGTARINAVMSGASFMGDGSSFTITETTHKDASGLMCMMSLPQPMTIAEIKALKAEIEKAEPIGAMDGDVGSPPGMGSAATIIMGSYKRPGNNPGILFNVTSMERFTNLILSKSTFEDVK